MKLSYISLCGFRGYRKPVRIDFAESFTIVDGRNGAGKSTIFDAVEFALTGSISKYGTAKVAGESVDDYLWWLGEGYSPEDRFVEVGFRDSSGEFCVRRTQFGKGEPEGIENIASKLCDLHLAPSSPLAQLCKSSIIRDEHIASLSLDLKESDRYALLREALGAIDAEYWIDRGNKLSTRAKRRLSETQNEVAAANNAVTDEVRRIDEIRSSLVSESVLAEAVERLRSFAGTQAVPDQLAGPVRERIAEVSAEIEDLESLVNRWEFIAAERASSSELAQLLERATRENEDSAAALAEFHLSMSSSRIAGQARDLMTLVSLGRRIGLRDGHCPLCAKDQNELEFERGLATAETLAKQLDEEAAHQAQLEQARADAQDRLEASETNLANISARYQEHLNLLNDFNNETRLRGLENGSLEQIVNRIENLRRRANVAQRDLHIVETLNLNAQLISAQHKEADAKSYLARAQERSGRARKAESTAQALYDATRRAVGENLDHRLDRVLPLMSELYQRLRPHPSWHEIEYSVRGDVRRFLKLQVGDELNPQFLFSSGQRRATGLAFLLSVNMSLAWSRWRSILLDDPIQHVDDFRAVHLVEVAAQLVAEGRQIICAVEDAALADLFCRRLPVAQAGVGKRVTLGPDKDGALGKIDERQLTPLIRHSLVGGGDHAFAS